MDARAMALLTRIYDVKNEDGHDPIAFWPLHRLDVVSKADLTHLWQVGLAPDTAVELTHDDAVARLRGAVTKLRLEDVATGFIAGVGGSAPRERQTLISYAYARHLPRTPHRRSGDGPCSICEIPLTTRLDRTGELFGWWRGSSWNEQAVTFVLDLEERCTRGTPVPTPDDITRFATLLDAIDTAPARTTASVLERRIAKARILPGTERYDRYGVLQALAVVGVLPNDYLPSMLDEFTTFADVCRLSAKIDSGVRSDIVLPLAGWRGGVDWKRAKVLFPQVAITSKRPAARARVPVTRDPRRTR